MIMPKVFLPEMSFAEVEDILDQVKLATLPTGSNEGHGPHLPLFHSPGLEWDNLKRLG